MTIDYKYHKLIDKTAKPAYQVEEHFFTKWKGGNEGNVIAKKSVKAIKAKLSGLMTLCEKHFDFNYGIASGKTIFITRGLGDNRPATQQEKDDWANQVADKQKYSINCAYRAQKGFRVLRAKYFDLVDNEISNRKMLSWEDFQALGLGKDL